MGVDFCLLMYHVAAALHSKGSGPFFYLSKLEGSTEAALWNRIFIWSQEQLGLPGGTIKACVLIENSLLPLRWRKYFGSSESIRQDSTAACGTTLPPSSTSLEIDQSFSFQTAANT